MPRQMPFKRARKSEQTKTLRTWLLPSKEDGAVKEFRVFQSGGRPAIAVLERVWKNILKEYGIPLHRVYAICHRAGMSMKDEKIRAFEA